MAREEVLQGLLARGVPPHVAQGILGNISVESGFNPGINEINPVVKGSRGGFGLFQHTGPRRRQLEAFAQSSGRPVDSIDTQLDFAMHELSTTEKRAGQALSGAKTAEEAARIFSEQFLRPGVPHLDRRIAAATGAPVVSTQGSQKGTDFMPQEQKRSGIAGLLGGGGLQEGGILSPDRRDRLILALQGLTMNPNVALQQSALQGLQERREDRGSKDRANRTGEFLRQRGRDDLASAVESGAIPASVAVQEALKGQAQTKGVEINGQLVNPVTGEVIGDFRNGDKDVPASFRALELRAEAAGLSPGTPEHQNFMLTQGRSEGFALTVGPDGTVSLAQGGAKVKPLTESQSKSATFAVRAEGALPILDEFDTELTSAIQRAAGSDPTGVIRGSVQTPEFQKAQQASEEFLQAILRKDTGAAITEQEQALYGNTYIPRPGDSPAIVAQKRVSRKRALEALKSGMSADAILAQENALARVGSDTEPKAGKVTHRWNPETGQLEAIK